MQTSTPNIFKTDYLLQELTGLLQNDHESAPRLLENLMNVDYDFTTKEEYYKILTHEQRQMWHRIYLKRKESELFDQKFQMIVLIAAGAVGIGYGALKLVEYIEKKQDKKAVYN